MFEDGEGGKDYVIVAAGLPWLGLTHRETGPQTDSQRKTAGVVIFSKARVPSR